MPEFSYKQTLHMRRNYVGRACKLHFEVAPLKFVRASKQYFYDDSGVEYLDCISNVSHVGHCHPHVVHAGQKQMAKLSTCTGFLHNNMVEYAKRIIETFPDKLSVCFFVNSGSEANDMALRMARSYTKHEDVIVFENAYHGNIAAVLDVSPNRWKTMGIEKKEWVHTVPPPDTYRGKYRDDLSNSNLMCLYSDEVKNTIKAIHQKNRQVAAFLSEPLMSLGGVIVPSKPYLSNVYRHVREAGGVCIADEVQVGLGRTGENFWTFQSLDVVPDIVTVGKPLGNGYPLSIVVTTKEIADSIGEFSSTFGGNPVACAVGLAVLDVMHNEKLMSSAKSVGKCLLDGFRAIMPNHPMIGDVRGMGMIVGVEIVMDKENRKPAKEAAEILIYKLKEANIVIANEGPDKNVLLLTPPLCFTCDNARHVVQTVDVALSQIEKGASEVGLTTSVNDPGRGVPLDILTSIPSASDLGPISDSDDEPNVKKARYEEVD